MATIYDFIMTAGDRLPSFQSTLELGGTAVDLTGCTVVFQFKHEDATAATSSSATIVTAASGVVRYDWGASDLSESGDYTGKWVVTHSTGKTFSVPNDRNIIFKVNPAL